MALKENDFIEVEYTGRTKEENLVFDTTDKALAQKEGIFSPKTAYGPVVVCLGKGQLLPGLDAKLIGKDIGKHEVELTAEEGFGKKSAKYIQLVPTSKFKKEQIMPHPGLQVNIDGQMGMIKTVSGGRTLVDFNHPLSSKELKYSVEIKRIVTEVKEKLVSVLKLQLGLKSPEVEIKEEIATVFIPQELPKEMAAPLSKEISEMVGLKEIMFKKKEIKKEVKKEEPVAENAPKSSETKQ